MLAQAAQLAEAGNLAAPERFFLIETEGGYAVWDDIREEIYVDPEGVSEEFTSEWQAEDYLAQVKKEVAERDAADWLAVEQAKLPPLKYANLLNLHFFGFTPDRFSQERVAPPFVSKAAASRAESPRRGLDKAMADC